MGLKSDITVVAVGQNNMGQRDVDSWTDIIQVTARAGHTVGLKADGTLVAVGNQDGNKDYGQYDVDGWDLN